VRVAQEEALRRPQARERERLGHALLLGLDHSVDSQALGDGLVDGVPRVERARRVLEHELHAAPVGLQRLGRRGERLCVDEHLARRRLLQAEDRARQRGLAAAALADEREDLAAAEVEVDAVHRAGDAARAAAAEGDLEGAGLQRGGSLLGGHAGTSAR
jgi:hypothetical protein